MNDVKYTFYKIHTPQLGYFLIWEMFDIYLTLSNTLYVSSIIVVSFLILLSPINSYNFPIIFFRTKERGKKKNNNPELEVIRTFLKSKGSCQRFTFISIQSDHRTTLGLFCSLCTITFPLVTLCMCLWQMCGMEILCCLINKLYSV